MNTETIRDYCIAKIGATESFPFGGDALVFKVGGKMFALVDLDKAGGPVISYGAGAARYNDLLELDGILPAPYMARIFWVAAERWGVHRDAVWEDELRAAHALTLAKMPVKVRAVLDLPAKELKKAVADRRKLLVERAATSAKKPRNK